MNFEEKIIERLKRLEREVERLRVWERPAGGSGVTDHGDLTGLGDNDHPQYLLTTAKAADSDKLDGLDSTGFVQTSGNQTVGGIKTFTSIPALPATNPTTANQAVRKGFADATYLGISAKAADSDKLDGLDSTDFGRPVFLTSPLTSTAWDGDAYSTTATGTLIDLSAVFGVPDGVKAILARIYARDSAALGTAGLYFRLGPTSINCLTVEPIGGDCIVSNNGICPCDSNGDVSYSISASGPGTMDCYINIWGYWL